MTESSKKKRWKPFLVQMALALCAFAIAMWNMGLMQAATALERARIISDAAFIIAAFFGGIGVIVLVATTGFFDIIGYGFKSFWYMFTPFGRAKDMPAFYDYKVEKAEKRGETRWEMFAVGMVMLAVSVIALMLFHRYS